MLLKHLGITVFCFARLTNTWESTLSGKEDGDGETQTGCLKLMCGDNTHLVLRTLWGKTRVLEYGERGSMPTNIPIVHPTKSP